jgi:hypothetical protein
MTDLDSRRKKRQTPVEGFTNVPNILEEARRAVDDVTQTPWPRGRKIAGPLASLGGKRGGTATTPKAPTAGPRRKSAKEGSRAKKLPPLPALRVPGSAARATAPAAAVAPVAPAPAPVPATPPFAARPTRGLADCGIRVKHALPGRVRLRLRNLLHNETLAAKLPSQLTAVPGIASAEASSASGSLLIIFSPGELAAPHGRRELAGVMHRFFPGLDMEDLLQRLLGY